MLVMDALRSGIRPRDLLTREAFENAIAAAAGTGGSTNSVLHLLALAREAGVPLEIEDFDQISRRTPIVADLKPGGRYVALDVDRAGGIELIMKRMIEGELVRGNAPTVTGRSLAQESAAAVETPGQAVIATAERPVQTDRRPRDSQGKPCARRSGGEDRGARAGISPWPGAYLRSRRSRHGRD